MAKADTAAVARKSLDAKFLDGSLGALAARPARGWIRAIRDALGMSSRQLATRMGQSQPAVSQLEHSEVDDRITLATLRRAADALECDLVYALVPRTTLDDTVRRRARSLARRDVAVRRPDDEARSTVARPAAARRSHRGLCVSAPRWSATVGRRRRVTPRIARPGSGRRDSPERRGPRRSDPDPRGHTARLERRGTSQHRSRDTFGPFTDGSRRSPTTCSP